MNAKVIKILEKTEKLLSDECLLDSYFNASEERQSQIEKELNDHINLINADRAFVTDLNDKLEYICGEFNVDWALRIKTIVQLVK